jgi:hypothetical protein
MAFDPSKGGSSNLAQSFLSSAATQPRGNALSAPFAPSSPMAGGQPMPQPTGPRPMPTPAPAPNPQQQGPGQMPIGAMYSAGNNWYDQHGVQMNNTLPPHLQALIGGGNQPRPDGLPVQPMPQPRPDGLPVQPMPAQPRPDGLPVQPMPRPTPQPRPDGLPVMPPGYREPQPRKVQQPGSPHVPSFRNLGGRFPGLDGLW